MLPQRIYHIPRNLLAGLVRGYQLIISPHLPRSCRYTPTCSQYAIESFKKYGVLKGFILTVHRLSRCHPWGGSGFDPPRWYGEQGTPSTDEPTTP